MLGLGRPKKTGVTDVIRRRVEETRRGSQQNSKNVCLQTLLLTPDPTRAISKSYKDFERIGDGAFGTVFKAHSIRTGDIFAIKQVPKNDVEQDMEYVYAELEAMIKLDHPNVVKFFEYFEDDDMLYVVTEVCAGGDFGDLNHGIDDPLEIKMLFKDMVKAVAYCHENGVAHRDLKFENALIHKTQGQRRVAKVIDFGLAAIRRPDDTASHWLNEQLGTRYFVAPEVVDSRTHYGVECDCWSMGVMLYIILTDEHPFAAAANKLATMQLFRKILHAAMRTEPMDSVGLSDDARDFLQKLLERDTEKRMTANEALNHPWLELKETPHSWRSASNVGRTRSWTNDSDSREEIIRRIGSFGETSRFEKAVLMLVAHHAQCHEVEDLRSAFAQLDTSQTGTLSKDDITKGFAACGFTMSDEDISKIFASLDVDGTGQVRYTEWLAATITSTHVQSAKYVRQVFDFLDLDGSGKISKAELCKMLGNEWDADKALERADLDGDGVLTFDDFQALMSAIAARLEANGRNKKQ